MAFHRNSPTRQVINWEEVVSRLGDCVLMPVSPAVFYVACNLLGSRGLWQSTFIVEPLSTGYNSPDTTSEDWHRYEDEVGQFIRDGQEFMTKFNDFIKSQNDLVKTQLLLTFAVTNIDGSGTVNLNTPEIYLTGEHTPQGSIGELLQTYLELGNTNLANMNEKMGIGNENTVDMIGKLEEIRQVLLTIAGNSPSGLADELIGISQTIGNVASILGAGGVAI
jgi:hypothetical protein